MARKRENPIVRKPRADAERNRQQLLDTAKTLFADKGAGTSLEEIARAAGVGIGTLYRHFPTRDALVEAVYRNETAQLAKAATLLAKKHPPVEALRRWMLLFVDHMATKSGMSEALSSLVCGTSELYAASSKEMTSSIHQLVDRAVASGEIRTSIDPVDFLRALAGVANIGNDGNWQAGAKLMVDVLIAGVRTPR